MGTERQDHGRVEQRRLRGRGGRDTYRLLLVAFSICSSRAVLAPDDHQLIISEMGGGAGEGMGGVRGW